MKIKDNEIKQRNLHYLNYTFTINDFDGKKYCWLKHSHADLEMAILPNFNNECSFKKFEDFIIENKYKFIKEYDKLIYESGECYEKRN